MYSDIESNFITAIPAGLFGNTPALVGL